MPSNCDIAPREVEDEVFYRARQAPLQGRACVRRSLWQHELEGQEPRLVHLAGLTTVAAVVSARSSWPTRNATSLRACETWFEDAATRASAPTASAGDDVVNRFEYIRAQRLYMTTCVALRCEIQGAQAALRRAAGRYRRR